MHIRAVLFDLDNTLVHRRQSIDAYAEVFVREYASHLGSQDLALITDLIAAQDNGGYLSADSPHPTIRMADVLPLLDQANIGGRFTRRGSS